MDNQDNKRLNFIKQIIKDDLSSGKHQSIQTRFPPEPNGYLHIGHAKAISVSFGIASEFNGKCNLRFDDTNPEKEEATYVESIKEDIKWLGFEWNGDVLFTSDYFETLYNFAVNLIKKGLAYVDDLNSDEIAELKGTPHQAGKPSPFRERSVEDNLRMFDEMKAGVYNEGEKSLRAKIDMASPNMHMRDPIMYRIKKDAHHRTGKAWSVYPMYDFAHGQSDAIESVTHSLCTLEFEVHRPLYNWFIENLEIYPSRQIEYARLHLSNTVLSKRKLLQLVKEGHVTGWDDPRMPTISGLRRKGYSPESIRNFTDRIGVAKRNGITDVALLEFSVREDLNKRAIRRFGVMDPVKLTITNYPAEVEILSGDNNPEDENAGSREIPFGKHLVIEKSDFMIDPPKKFFRLGPGREVRLKHAYIIKCEDYITDPETGEVNEILCTYDPATKSGQDKTGKKVKGTLSWVSEPHGISAEVRIYNKLFLKENMNDLEEGKDFIDYLNPDSLKVIQHAIMEPAIAEAKPGDYLQLIRLGYYMVDIDSNNDQLILNQSVSMRDSKPKK